MCDNFSKTRTYPSQAKNVPTSPKSSEQILIFLINSDKGITKYVNRVYCLIDFRKVAIYQRL